MTTERLDHVNFDKIPVDYMIGGMRNYLEHGIKPGSFMYSVLTNDLKGAFQYADETNALFIREWVEWIYRECPASAQGSIEKVSAWMERVGKAI